MLTSMLNQPVENFSLPSTDIKPFVLSEHLGHPLVLYFYPKDNTPGCTNQGKDFRDHHADFEKFGCQIVGISRDGLKSHHNFREKFALPFHLLSDTEETLCRKFDVIKTKKMYGKEVQGIQRSTFVLDAKGVMVQEWRGVKVEGHALEVLNFIKTMA